MADQAWADHSSAVTWTPGQGASRESWRRCCGRITARHHRLGWLARGIGVYGGERRLLPAATLLLLARKATMQAEGCVQGGRGEAARVATWRKLRGACWGLVSNTVTKQPWTARMGARKGGSLAPPQLHPPALGWAPSCCSHRDLPHFLQAQGLQEPSTPTGVV